MSVTSPDIDHGNNAEEELVAKTAQFLSDLSQKDYKQDQGTSSHHGNQTTASMEREQVHSDSYKKSSGFWENGSGTSVSQPLTSDLGTRERSYHYERKIDATSYVSDSHNMLCGINKAKLLSAEVKTTRDLQPGHVLPEGGMQPSSYSFGTGIGGHTGRNHNTGKDSVISEPPSLQRRMVGTSTGVRSPSDQGPSQAYSRKPRRREEGDEKKQTEAKRLTDLTPPLNASRLRPIRQQTRNAVVRR